VVLPIRDISNDLIADEESHIIDDAKEHIQW